MVRGDIEVQPDGDSWDVQVQGTGEVVGVFTHKDQAEQFARTVARGRNVELFIKGQDGVIQDKDSHGNDPPEIEG